MAPSRPSFQPHGLEILAPQQDSRPRERVPASGARRPGRLGALGLALLCGACTPEAAAAPNPLAERQAEQQAKQQGVQGQRRFADPAPPKPNKLAAVAAPAAKPFPELKFVATPKPLRKDAVVEDWPGFLGARRDGRSRETRLLKKWPDGGPALVWSMERGEGYASPAIQGDHLVFTHRVRGEAVVECLHAETGQRFWRFAYPCDFRGLYEIGDSGPRATPQIDGDRVYVHGVEGMLHCLELATGRVLWKRNLLAEFGLRQMFFGVVVSPLIVGDLLITNLGAPDGPCVAAFDKHKGHLVWGSGDKWGMSCASPVLATVHGKPRLFVLTGGESRPPTGGLMVLDPGNGAIDLEFPFRSRTYESVSGATPVVAGSRVFITAAYSTGTAALDLAADGTFEKAWHNKRTGVEFATPLYIDGYLHNVMGAHNRVGRIVCMDPADGKVAASTDLTWDEEVDYLGERRKLGLSIGAGCLIWADGAFLCLGDNGHLLWVESGPEGAKVLARSWLFGANTSWTPPVVCRGLLYVCQNKREQFGDAPARLLCYDLRESED